MILLAISNSEHLMMFQGSEIKVIIFGTLW